MLYHEVKCVLVNEQASEGKPFPEELWVDKERLHERKNCKDGGYTWKEEFQLHSIDIDIT